MLSQHNRIIYLPEISLYIPCYIYMRRCVYFFLLFSLICSLTGCQKNTLPEKKKDLDFTVVAGTDIPPELQELIDDRVADPFELTYSDGSCLYIVKGYGKKKTEGYNITVNNFYETSDGLVFDTELMGPPKNEEVSQTESYPYIVIKTEFIDSPVIFP